MYEVKVDLTAQKYVGITVEYNRINNVIGISVPGHIENTLLRFGIGSKPHRTNAPAPCPEKRYYDRTTQAATSDDTTPVGPREQKWIQEIV